MKKQYQRYAIVSLFIFFLSFYATSVYQNYQEKQEFDEWKDAVLENLSRDIAKQTKNNEVFYIKKMNASSNYTNEILFHEIEDTESGDIFSLIPFRSKKMSMKKWNYVDEVTYCLTEGAENSWIELHDYIRSFEIESSIKTGDWNKEIWREFLEFLDKELSDHEKIQREYQFVKKKIEEDTDIQSLKNFHNNMIQRYKVNIEGGETVKALFDLGTLKSFDTLMKKGGKLPYFSEKEYPLMKQEYLALIKQNLKCSVPVTLWIGMVYIAASLLIRRKYYD